MKFDNISEELKLKDNQILIITNHGDFIIDYTDYDKFVEDNVVSYGEEGITFNILLVIDKRNCKYNAENAEIVFNNKSDWY